MPIAYDRTKDGIPNMESGCLIRYFASPLIMKPLPRRPSLRISVQEMQEEFPQENQLFNALIMESEV
jgi:hypothetical protein